MSDDGTGSGAGEPPASDSTAAAGAGASSDQDRGAAAVASSASGADGSADDGGETGEAGDGAEMSALEENLRRKGKFSYYYSHENNLRGKVAPSDPSTSIGLPRKIASTPEAEGAATPSRRRVAPVAKYSWCNFEKNVKVYVPWEGADGVPEDRVTLTSGDKSFCFTVAGSGGSGDSTDRVLDVPKLAEPITGAKLRVKPDKFVIVLAKKDTFTWYDLKAT